MKEQPLANTTRRWNLGVPRLTVKSFVLRTISRYALTWVGPILDAISDLETGVCESAPMNKNEESKLAVAIVCHKLNGTCQRISGDTYIYVNTKYSLVYYL